MARIPLQDPEHALEAVQPTFHEIERAFGFVPNIFRAYANHPALLRSNWEKLKAILMGGELPRALKEGIALAVSADNSCAYCVAAHGQALQGLGVTAERVEALKAGEAGHGFGDAEAALLEMARVVNRDPGGLEDAALARVRQAGWSDAQIVEAIGVVEIFAGFNRFLDALEVEIDF